MRRKHPPRNHGNGAHADTDVGADAVLHAYVQGHGRTIVVFTQLPDGRFYECVYAMRPGESAEMTCDRIRPVVMARADHILDAE